MTALEVVPARKILRAIASAAERWSDADFPPRVRAADAVCERAGYSLPMVDYALDRLFFSVTEDALSAVVESELGSLNVLDGFQKRSGRPDAWAQPIGNVCVISSRTTIGVAIVPSIFALCAKCDVLVKDREDFLVRAFFGSLREELDEFAAAANAEAWHPGDQDAPDLSTFDAVVAFGSDETLSAVGSALPLHATRFIPYGSRASAGYVTRESLNEAAAREIAAGAARDLVLYESEGCLSLHVLFVERGGELPPEEFARRLALEVENANVEFPQGEQYALRTAEIAHLRDVGAFRAAAAQGAVYSNDRAEFALVFDPPPAQPPAFLPRTLGILPVDDPEEAVRYVNRQKLPLEGFALSQGRPDLVDAALRTGAVRLASFGELQHPPLAGHHGGRPRIGEFIRWIDKTP